MGKVHLIMLKRRVRVRIDILQMIKLMFLLFGGLLVLGCAEMAGLGVEFPVYGEPERDCENAHYEVGKIYELKVDLFLKVAKGEELYKRGKLVAPRNLTIGLPQIESALDSIEEWTAGADVGAGVLAPGETYILGIVPKGTKIQYVKECTVYSLSVFYGYDKHKHPIGVILSGEFSGWEMDLKDISIWYPLISPNFNFIANAECLMPVYV